MQMLVHVISFAFLVVIASTAMFVPILLYVFDLKKLGWTWEHAALFSAMIASTDAVAVSAILKKGVKLHSRCSEMIFWLLKSPGRACPDYADLRASTVHLQELCDEHVWLDK